MIPERLVAFLHGPVVMNVGTRDAQLRSFLNWVIGARVNADRQTITFYVHAPQSARMLQNLQDNGRVALVADEMPSHEAYQLKGAYVSSRPGDDADRSFQEGYRERLIARFNDIWPGLEAYWRSIAYTPSIAVTFQVETIFVQTPGPGAGDQMALEAGMA